MSLARGWSPTRRQALAARFVLGTLLLLTPLWLGFVPLDLDGTEYRYRTTDVTVEAGELAFAAGDDVTRLHGVDGIACSSDNPFLSGRLCGFERELSAGGPRTLPGLHDRTPSPRYVQVGERYFERNTTLVDDGTRVSLEPVPAETVLEDIAVRPGSLPLAGEWVVRTGSVATDERAEFEGRVVRRSDGDYELVYLRGYSRSSSAGIEPVVWLVGIVGGTALLRSGYRRLDE